MRALLVLLLVALSAHPGRAQIVRLSSPDAAGSAFFGGAVALSGSVLAVGATGDSVCGTNSGAVYLFERHENSWKTAGRLAASDCSEEAYFGRAVALDGKTLAVTAFHSHLATARSNAVYIFERDANGAWTENARFDGGPTTDKGAFAASIALDGEHLLVTRSGDSGAGEFHGEAFMYHRTPEAGWRLDVRLSSDGPVSAGAFGTSAALSGGLAVVGASTYGRDEPGSLFVFGRDSEGEWKLDQTLRGIDDYFVPLSVSQGRIYVGETREGGGGDGRVTIFERDPRDVWIPNGALAAPSPYPSGGFGAGLASSEQRLVVVGFDEQLQLDINIDRVVYAFELTPRGWSKPQLIDIGAIYFGSSVAIDGSTAVIGETLPSGEGAVYIVTLR